MILIVLLSSIQELLRHIAKCDTGVRVSVLYLELQSMQLIYDGLDRTLKYCYLHVGFNVKMLGYIPVHHAKLEEKYRALKIYFHILMRFHSQFGQTFKT